jgi:glutathione S-transferase
MILHWSPRSPFVRKVMIVAHEIGLAERIGKVRSVTSMLVPNEPLMQLNPWSKIPTLITDDGKVLFDSDVICEYLDSLHRGPRLHPEDMRQRWQALYWRAFGSEMLDALILWRNENERPVEKQLPQLLAAFDHKVQGGLNVLETQAQCLRSAPFSVGHVAVGCALGYLELRFPTVPWRRDHPALCDWFLQFKQRRSVQLTEPFDDMPRFNAAGEPLP